LVRMIGLEPTLPCGNWNLNPLFVVLYSGETRWIVEKYGSAMLGSCGSFGVVSYRISYSAERPSIELCNATVSPSHLRPTSFTSSMSMILYRPLQAVGFLSANFHPQVLIDSGFAHVASCGTAKVVQEKFFMLRTFHSGIPRRTKIYYVRFGL
jgi:hypothetical protein